MYIPSLNIKDFLDLFALKIPDDFQPSLQELENEKLYEYYYLDRPEASPESIFFKDKELLKAFPFADRNQYKEIEKKYSDEKKAELYQKRFHVPEYEQWYWDIQLVWFETQKAAFQLDDRYHTNIIYYQHYYLRSLLEHYFKANGLTLAVSPAEVKRLHDLIAAALPYRTPALKSLAPTAELLQHIERRYPHDLDYYSQSELTPLRTQWNIMADRLSEWNEAVEASSLYELELKEPYAIEMKSRLEACLVDFKGDAEKREEIEFNVFVQQDILESMIPDQLTNIPSLHCWWSEIFVTPLWL